MLSVCLWCYPRWSPSSKLPMLSEGSRSSSSYKAFEEMSPLYRVYRGVRVKNICSESMGVFISFWGPYPRFRDSDAPHVYTYGYRFLPFPFQCYYKESSYMKCVQIVKLAFLRQHCHYIMKLIKHSMRSWSLH